MLVAMGDTEIAPLVSVCVPTYNYARFLPDCIESVLEQTLTDWELIVCDDGSTDDTAEVVRRYADHDPRIRYVRNATRLGMNGNIQHTINLGRGRYLKVLCSDDWIAEKCLEVMVDLMEANPEVALGTCAEIHCDATGAPLQVQFLFGKPLSVIQGEAMLDWMARGMAFGGNSSFLIRSSAYRTVGGYRGSTWYAGDYDLAARLCRVGAYLHTDQPLFYGRVQPASSSANDPKRLLDVRDRFEIPDLVFRPRVFNNREWWRYQVLTGYCTARYMLNAALEYGRGQHDYARNLAGMLRNTGNFGFGMPLLVFHLPVRLYNKLTGRNLPRARPPEPWMGTPAARRSRRGIMMTSAGAGRWNR
jgi:glycosyltransferase involved in cell wall biosynthesis